MQVKDFACTRSAIAVNICANSKIKYSITATSAGSGLRDISDSVPPNTKIADVTVLNQHNNHTTINYLSAAHYFTDTASITATTKSMDGTFATTASGNIFLDLSTPSIPKLKVWRSDRVSVQPKHGLIVGMII